MADIRQPHNGWREGNSREGYQPDLEYDPMNGSYGKLHPRTGPEKLTEWQEWQGMYLQLQAPLRAAWMEGDENAGKQLRQLVKEVTEGCP